MNNLQTTNNATGTKAISSFLNQSNVLEKFASILGEKAQGFIASTISAVNNNDMLKNATQESVYASALMAATLDLPVNQNLGFAYFIPFNNRKTGKQECQFQIGYKGFIQLAMRSGQFKTISATPIYEGQLIEENPLTGYIFDFSKKVSDKIIGYASYFSLINGFEKTMYFTVDELNKHSKSYSQTAKKGFGLWVDNFDAMALKTALKLLLSKYAPLSIEMQKAQIADQSIIRNVENMEVEYIDNQPLTINEIDEEKEKDRLVNFINTNAKLDDLQGLDTELLFKYNLTDLVDVKIEEIKETLNKSK